MRATTTVQTIIFSREHWTIRAASRWLRDNGFITRKTDITSGSYRFRQRDPTDFAGDSFRTISFTADIKAVIGRLK